MRAKAPDATDVIMDITKLLAIVMNGTRTQSIRDFVVVRVKADEEAAKFLCDYISDHVQEKGIAA